MNDAAFDHRDITRRKLGDSRRNPENPAANRASLRATRNRTDKLS